MRKIVLLFLLNVVVLTVKAQYLLRGSNYEQHFDALGSGLPEGWDVRVKATASDTGRTAAAGFVATAGTATRWSNASGAFKNVASANGFAFAAAATPALQLAAADRALGLRQTAGFGDPGAALVFRLAHTYGLSDFELSFKLQSLDSAAGGRLSTWQWQYALGDTPLVFTNIGTAFHTGAYTYSNTTATISLGALLDDRRVPVWLRFLAPEASSGGGSRTTTAIDDVRLSWRGMADTSRRPLLVSTFPLRNAADVFPGTAPELRFNQPVSLTPDSRLQITDETDHSTQVLSLADASVHGTVLRFSGARFKPLHSYHILFDSSLAESSGLYCYPVADSLAWRFTVGGRIATGLEEYFDTGCAGRLTGLGHWKAYSSTGAARWDCREYSAGNNVMRISAFDGSAFADEEDWLISPLLDLSATAADQLRYSLLQLGSGPEPQVLISHDYAGSGDPAVATWMSPVLLYGATVTPGSWTRQAISVVPYKSSPFYCALKYTATAAAGYDLSADSFLTAASVSLARYPILTADWFLYTEQGRTGLSLRSDRYASYQLQMFSMSGRLLWETSIAAVPGVLSTGLALTGLERGLYLVKLSGAGTVSWQRYFLP